MKDRIYYYIHDHDTRYDGNDCAWIAQNGSRTYSLDEAAIFSAQEAFDTLSTSSEKISIHPVHEVERLAQFHVPLSKIKRHKPKHGDKCYLVCTRDTCGKNAAFWRWNNCGYTSEIRAAQIFTFDENNPETSREIDVMVPVSVVKRKMERRVDIQDLRSDEKRMIPHTIDSDYFKER